MDKVIKCCKLESDHDWEFWGLFSGDDEYRCRKCGVVRIFPLSYFAYTVESSI